MQNNLDLPLSYAKDSKERMPWEHYLSQFKKVDPVAVSNRLKIPYNVDTQIFTINFIGTTYYIHYPNFEITHKEDNSISYPLEDNIYAKILVTRYLLDGYKVPSNGEFLAYRDMPSGDVYYRQFNGRCMQRLAWKYGTKKDLFEKIMTNLGATKVDYGDVCYDVEFMDDLYVRFILWESDDEFPPSSQILFSNNFTSAFTAEDLAYLGDICINTFNAIGKHISK